MEIAASLGRTTLNRFQILGRSGIFLFISLFQAFLPPFRISRLVKEIEFVGSNIPKEFNYTVYYLRKPTHIY